MLSSYCEGESRLGGPIKQKKKHYYCTYLLSDVSAGWNQADISKNDIILMKLCETDLCSVIHSYGIIDHFHLRAQCKKMVIELNRTTSYLAIVMILFSLMIPSILCSLFIFYHFIQCRELRLRINNHAILPLLMITFLQLTNRLFATKAEHFRSR